MMPGELMALAARGDREAFGAIYERYLDTVYRYLHYRCLNRQLAEDLAGETFARALRTCHSWTDVGKDPGAWLVTIARNLLADWFKSSRSRLETPIADILDVDAEACGPGASPETSALDHITNVALLAALKELSDEQREVIVLRFLNDLSISETAVAMRRNEGAIKALQYRAVRSLRRILGNRLDLLDHAVPPMANMPRPPAQRRPTNARRTH